MGGLMGGLLGETLGLRTTILVPGVGVLLSFLWVHFSPVPMVEPLKDEDIELALGQASTS